MVTLILTCYSAYSDEILRAAWKEYNVEQVCVWHPAAYQSHAFPPKTEYLMSVYKDVLKRARRLFPRVIKEIARVSQSSRVYIFRELVHEVDDCVLKRFRERVTFLRPLQYIYDTEVINHIAGEIEKGRGVRLQGFFQRVIQGIEELEKSRKFLIHSTDVNNRAAMDEAAEKHVDGLDDYPFAVTRTEALEHLSVFLRKRFAQFAKYQDAVVPGHEQLYHSKLSAPLNCGLITARDVINALLPYKHSNSFEAFLRQLLGWREYAVCYYVILSPVRSPVTPIEECMKRARKSFEKNNRLLKRHLWFGASYKKGPIELINNLLEPIWESGYAHHIIRLYILSFLIELLVDPRDIYKWMMAVFTDSLDFVMLFNVFAMGYFDRGFTHKEYIFSSQYIANQSGGRIKRDPQLDNLYRHFMHLYKKELIYTPITQKCDCNLAIQTIDLYTEPAM